jgi:hypothetical protein
MEVDQLNALSTAQLVEGEVHHDQSAEISQAALTEAAALESLDALQSNFDLLTKNPWDRKLYEENIRLCKALEMGEQLENVREGLANGFLLSQGG